MNCRGTTGRFTDLGIEGIKRANLDLGLAFAAPDNVHPNARNKQPWYRRNRYARRVYTDHSFLVRNLPTYVVAKETMADLE